MGCCASKEDSASRLRTVLKPADSSAEKTQKKVPVKLQSKSASSSEIRSASQPEDDFYDAKSFANETFYIRKSESSTIRDFPELLRLETQRRADILRAEATMQEAIKALGMHVSRRPSPVLVLADITLADGRDIDSLIDHTGALPGYSPHINFEEEAIRKARKGTQKPSAFPNTSKLIHLRPDGFDWQKLPKCNISQNWDILSIPSADEVLSRGECFMNFACKPAGSLSEQERAFANLVIGLDSLDAKQKGEAPKIDLYNPDDCTQYTLILTRASYLLPEIDLSKITPQFIASEPYQKGCLPGSPYLWPREGTSDEAMRTFRMTKPLIPYVFSIVIQMRTSIISDPDTLKSLEEIDNEKIAKAVLLERSKRTVGSKDDSTAKVRSILLYYELPSGGGVLVTNFTVVCNTTIPKIVASVVQSFGSRGASEIEETAHRTRKFILSHSQVLKEK